MDGRQKSSWFNLRLCQGYSRAAALAMVTTALAAGAPPPNYASSTWSLGAIASAKPHVPAPPPGTFAPAPTPDIDVGGPQPAPRAANQAEIAPSLFRPRDYDNSAGYINGSTVSAQQNARVKPSAGVNLRVPLQ